MADFDLGDYNTVAERYTEFKARHPEGSTQPWNPDRPYELLQVGERWFLVCVEAAYRTPDDPRPGVGVAWEPFPGKTNYTRDSELMNAQTGAQGRALVAVLAADTKKGIASREEVRNRQADREAPAVPLPVVTDPAWLNKFEARVAAAVDDEAVEALRELYAEVAHEGNAARVEADHVRVLQGEITAAVARITEQDPFR